MRSFLVDLTNEYQDIPDIRDLESLLNELLKPDFIKVVELTSCDLFRITFLDEQEAVLASLKSDIKLHPDTLESWAELIKCYGLEAETFTYEEWCDGSGNGDEIKRL
jgi:hypothetical protein